MEGSQRPVRLLKGGRNTGDHSLATLTGGQCRDTSQLGHYLLGQAAVSLSGSEAEGLVQIIGYITNLQRGDGVQGERV